MSPLSQSGRVHLDQLFWLRCLAIIGQFVTIGVVELFLHIHLPLAWMLAVISLEIGFNAMTWVRASERSRAETNPELFGQLFVDLVVLTALLFLSGGITNPFVSLYLPSLAIAAAVLPLRLALWLAVFAVISYLLLSVVSVPLKMDDPQRLFDYFQAGLWVDFMVSVGLIAWFVSRMSHALRMRDAALAQAQRRLLRDERVVALGAQAASVAHEIGTPLSSVMLLSEELRHAAAGDAALAPYRDDFKLLEQQLALCKSALARLQVRASSPTRQPLGAWLPEFIEQWRLRHPHVNFELVGPAPEDAPLDDTVAVGQILTILLDNAARASPDAVTLEVCQCGGDAKVGAEVGADAKSDVKPDSATAVQARKTGARSGFGFRSALAVESGFAAFDRAPYLELRVSDRGSGIDPELRDTLGLTPVDSTLGGHGVGLYLAFATASQLSGSIELLDAPEGGTLAILRLPAARGQTNDE
nr:ATP-binding protein [Burkholderia sp. L27(2015)]